MCYFEIKVWASRDELYRGWLLSKFLTVKFSVAALQYFDVFNSKNQKATLK